MTTFIPAGFPIDDNVDKVLLALLHQRLVHLRHAHRCRHELTPESSCAVSRGCLMMKRVLQHASKCTDRTCAVRFCASTRQLVQHFAACQDRRCVVCVPVHFSGRRAKSPADERQLLDEVDEYAGKMTAHICGDKWTSETESVSVSVSVSLGVVEGLQSLSLCPPCALPSLASSPCELS